MGTSERTVVAYGHSKSDRDCLTPELFRLWVTDLIWSRDKGRYRYTKSKDVGITLLSLEGFVHGHFVVDGGEDPNDDDRAAFEDVKHVYRVQSAVLYENPVRLWDFGVKAIHTGPVVPEEIFRRIIQAAGKCKETTASTVPTPQYAEASAIADDRPANRILFLRIAWMKSYDGASDDVPIHGGGAFVREHGYGHEMFNFRPYDGRLFGYVRPPRGTGEFVDGAGIKLERIGGAKSDRELKGVLVIWVASPPEGGTFVIGWYRNATVYRECQPAPVGSNRIYKDQEFGYYISAAFEDAKLLDLTERTFPVPYQQKGGIGQSNVWYADDLELHHDVRQKVLDLVEGVPASKKSEFGSPRQVDPLLRCRVERAAVEFTTAHFEERGYEVASQEKDNVGWDLLATCGSRELRLEVKGLAGDTLCVELTPNEFAKLQQFKDSYHVCVVTNALTSPKLTVFSYSPESGCWQDDRNRKLQIEPIIGARCRL